AQGAADDPHALLQRLYAQSVSQPGEGAVGRGIRRHALAAVGEDHTADQAESPGAARPVRANSEWRVANRARRVASRERYSLFRHSLLANSLLAFDKGLPMRTQVGIVGAGPAGLLLAHLLRRDGIESVVLENRTQQYVIERVRAGLLEQGTVDLLDELGLAGRLHREGLAHHGLSFRFHGESHRIPLTELTDKVVTIYGQNEVMKDLIEARLARGEEIRF